MKLEWNKKYTQWIENRTLYLSIPFTWELPRAKDFVRQMSFLWDGVSRRVDRLKALGNAIVTQVVVPIMEAIKTIEERSNKPLQPKN